MIRSTDPMLIYDIIARGYRHWRTRGWSIVKVIKGRYVLDLGSGTCIQGVELFRRYGGASYIICIDISTKMLEIGREEFFEENLIDFIAADASYLPLKNSGIDGILAIASLHHIDPETLPKVINEMARVIRKGRLILITTWYPWQLTFIPKLIINYLVKLLVPTMFPRKLLVPWRRRGMKVLRTYYLYTMNELDEVLRRKFKVLVKCLYTPFKRRSLSSLNNVLIAYSS